MVCNIFPPPSEMMYWMIFISLSLQRPWGSSREKSSVGFGGRGQTSILSSRSFTVVWGGAFEMINENHFCKYCCFCSLLNIVEMLVDERWDSKIGKSITPQCLCSKAICSNGADSRHEREIFRLFDPEKCHVHFVKHC